MKHKYLKRFLIWIMLLTSVYPASAFTDVTATYLVNPSFEDGLTGWVSYLMTIQSNSGFSVKKGNNYVEKYVKSGTKVGNASISQEIENLPCGTYELVAIAQNIKESNTSSLQTGAWIFADNNVTKVTKPRSYTLRFEVVEGRVKVGFKAEEASGNWLACDYFVLRFISFDVDKMKAELQKRVDNAKLSIESNIPAELKATLQKAVAAMEVQIAEGTEETVPAVARELHAASDQADVYIKAHAKLQDAITKALAVYGEGGLNEAETFDNVIKDAQSKENNGETSVEDMENAVQALSVASLNYQLSNPTGEAPVVVTNPQYARGNVVAYCRSTVTGTDIIERGFCFSKTNPEPTIFDSRSSGKIAHNGTLYKLENLKPGTIYYARAYAMSSGYAVGYGDVIKVITIPKGNITCSFNSNGATGDEYDRLNNSMLGAVDYWNRLTSINGFHVTVNYSPGTPTADCSYGGWIRVGTNPAYQRIGTILHEMLHGVGVGTTGAWWGELRADGTWAGDNVKNVLNFWEDKPNQQLYGDGMHMWPYGINGSGEDNGTEELYTINGLLCEALCEDGLIPTSNFTHPYYSFDVNEGTKYYIKNEDPERGLLSSYLTADENGNLVWKEMTSASALNDDHNAWYITFTPSNALYQIQNVATGQYISYAKSGVNGIKMADVSAPAANESFHLMRSRVNVQMNADVTANQRGYWIIHDGKAWTPDCLSAQENGVTTTASFDISNKATQQRWLLMAADQMDEFDSASHNAYQSIINNKIEQVKKMMAVPHREDVEGVDATTLATIETIQTKLNEPSVTLEELSSMEQQLATLGMDFLAGVTPLSKDEPFDLTFLLNNPNFDMGSGWSENPVVSYSCGEFYERTYNMSQTLTGMPAGTYQLKAQGFERPGEPTAVCNQFLAGKNQVTAKLYINNEEVLIQHACEDAPTQSLGGDVRSFGSPSRYIPNNMEAASKCFAAGLYDNEVVIKVTDNNATLKMGVTTNVTNSRYWSIFDNFRLYYYGSMEPQTVGIEAVNGSVQGEEAADVYTLNGVKLGVKSDALHLLPKGIYVVKRQKVLVK